MKTLVLTNWKTAAGALIFLAIALLLHFHDLTVEQALTLLAAAGAYLSTVAGDARKGGGK